MRFRQLAIVGGAFPYSSMPSTIELEAAFTDDIRTAGTASIQQDGEASMVLVKDAGAGTIEFRHLRVDPGASARPQVTQVASPSSVIGTVHTHPQGSAKTRLSAEMAGLMGEKGNALVGREVGPLAYSTADIVGMAGSMQIPGLEERFSFLLVMPETLYLLIWAKDSIYDIVRLNERLIECSLEEILDAGEEDEVEIPGDLMPVLMQQASPVVAIRKVAKEFRIAFYGGKIPVGSNGGVTLHRFTPF